MPQYQGLDLLIPRVCPSCQNTGHISTQRWRGEIEYHCNKCGYSYGKIGAAKQPEPDTNHIRNNNVAIILTRCQNTPKIGSAITKKLGVSTELLEDCKTAGLLHQVAPDIYLTSSRGRRFIENRNLIKNILHTEASN